MTCQQCGAEVLKGAAFCQACGATLSADGSATHAASPGKQALTGASNRQRAGGADVEKTLWEGSFSKLAMIGSWITAGAITLGVIVLGLVFQFNGSTWMWSLVGVGAVWAVLLLRLLYMQLSIRYTLTNQRFMHERGLLWRQQDRIETIDIDDVTVQQGPVQRMLGVGTIRVVSSDQTTPQFILAGIEDVRQVASMIDEARRTERRKRGVHIESV